MQLRALSSGESLTSLPAVGDKVVMELNVLIYFCFLFQIVFRKVTMLAFTINNLDDYCS